MNTAEKQIRIRNPEDTKLGHSITLSGISNALGFLRSNIMGILHEFKERHQIPVYDILYNTRSFPSESQGDDRYRRCISSINCVLDVDFRRPDKYGHITLTQLKEYKSKLDEDVLLAITDFIELYGIMIIGLGAARPRYDPAGEPLPMLAIDIDVDLFS